jgi:hypothetical protein
MMGSGKMPSLPGMGAAAPTMGGGPRPSATRKASSKRKKRKRENRPMAVKLRLTRIGSKLLKGIQ